MPDLIVIGAGAAGMMAALTAAQHGISVMLIERNQKLGRKLYITGKGRCNVTNECSAEEVLQNIPHNSRFLTSCMTRFPPQSVMSLFQNLNVPLKTERGNRVFPVSDRSADIIDALLMALRQKRVELIQDRVISVHQANALFSVETEHGSLSCKSVILATGGMSYPLTGSTGDGYTISEAFGHAIIEPTPSLVPLVAEQDFCAKMQGLSLRNVKMMVRNRRNKIIFEDQGELLFTHFGCSGPLVLSASTHMREYQQEHYQIIIDLKPALDAQKLDARLLREFSAHTNRAFHNVLESLVPRLMVPVFIERLQIPADTPVHSITKEQRHSINTLLKEFTIDIKGPRPIEEAIVTAGGVKVSEVNPKTMASKLISGLFFAGELLDVDAYTGGFNLQIAWSTGFAAGEGAAQYCSLMEDGES